MTTSWSKLRGLSRGDWAVLLRCLWTIPGVEFSVRWRAPRHWLPAPAATPPPPPSAAPPAQADRVAQLVDAVYRRAPFSPTCLTRSLVLYRILRARGIPCQLRIGLRRSEAKLEGHAWTEAGRPVAEADGFEVMLSF